MMNKPFAQSCEDNKQVILDVITPWLSGRENCLEIGSGTGQHAVHFAQHLNELQWQPSELAENIAGIKSWMLEAGLENILEPLVIDVADSQWPLNRDYSSAFTANTLHIMSIDHVEKCFAGVGQALESQGIFINYGPFNYDGQFTSESNARFDLWLKQRDPLSGVRDLKDLQRFAEAAGLSLKEDIEMPVNNRVLIWQKI